MEQLTLSCKQLVFFSLLTSTLLPQGFAQTPSFAKHKSSLVTQKYKVENLDVQEKIIGRVSPEAFERFRQVPEFELNDVLRNGTHDISPVDAGDVLRNGRNGSRRSRLNNALPGSDGMSDGNSHTDNWNTSEGRDSRGRRRGPVGLPHLGNTGKNKSTGVSELRPSMNLRDHATGINGQESNTDSSDDQVVSTPWRVEGSKNGVTVETRSSTYTPGPGHRITSYEVRTTDTNSGRVTVQTTIKDHETGQSDTGTHEETGARVPGRVNQGDLAGTQTRESAPSRFRVILPSSRQPDLSFPSAPVKVNPGKNSQTNPQGPRLKVGKLDDSPDYSRDKENLEDSAELREMLREQREDILDRSAIEKPQN